MSHAPRSQAPRRAGGTTAVMLGLIAVGAIAVVLTVFLILGNVVGEDAQETLPGDQTVPSDGTGDNRPLTYDVWQRTGHLLDVAA